MATTGEKPAEQARGSAIQANARQRRRIQQIAPVETLQPQYSLIERDVERDIPMGSGMLMGGMTRERLEQLAEDDWRKHDPRLTEPQLSRNFELVQRLTRIADRHDTAPGAVAVAWTLTHPAVDGAIVGFRRPDQVDPILAAANLELTDEDLDEIEGETR